MRMDCAFPPRIRHIATRLPLTSLPLPFTPHPSGLPLSVHLPLSRLPPPLTPTARALAATPATNRGERVEDEAGRPPPPPDSASEAASVRMPRLPVRLRAEVLCAKASEVGTQAERHPLRVRTRRLLGEVRRLPRVASAHPRGASGSAPVHVSSARVLRRLTVERDTSRSRTRVYRHRRMWGASSSGGRESGWGYSAAKVTDG